MLITMWKKLFDATSITSNCNKLTFVENNFPECMRCVEFILITIQEISLPVIPIQLFCKTISIKIPIYELKGDFFLFYSEFLQRVFLYHYLNKCIINVTLNKSKMLKFWAHSVYCLATLYWSCIYLDYPLLKNINKLIFYL